MKRIPAHLVLILAAVIAIAPFLWMLLTSFTIYGDALSPSLFGRTLTLNNYKEILERANFLAAFRNSVLVAVPSTLVVVLTSTAAGYPFAKYTFPGKELLFTLLLITMMIPFTAIVIPLFITMRDLGLVNSLNGLIVTGLCSTFGIFLMRQAIAGIPNDYIDAARVDGAGEFWILFWVIAPLVRPAMATLAVLTFLGNWDSYLWPSILIRTPDNQTLPMLLASMRSLFFERFNIWSAGSMLTVVPVMILFVFAQRYFTKGLALAGLKG